MSGLRIALLTLVSNLRADAENHGADIRHPRLVLENRANDAYRIVEMLDRAELAIKADALREAAEAQRQLARDARTGNGRAEHEDRADWLDDRANTIDPRCLEGAHP